MRLRCLSLRYIAELTGCDGIFQLPIRIKDFSVQPLTAGGHSDENVGESAPTEPNNTCDRYFVAAPKSSAPCSFRWSQAQCICSVRNTLAFR